MTDQANPSVKQDDPDHIQQTRDVVIDTGAQTIQLIPYHGTTNTEGRIGPRWGVTGQCVASFLALQWESDETLRSFDFPLEGVDRGKNFDLTGGWDWADDTTRKLLRDVGWSVRSAAGANPSQLWANLTTLGSFVDNDNDTAVIEQNPDLSVNDTVMATHPGPVNEAFRIWLDSDEDGTADVGEDKTSHMVVKIRTGGNTFGQFDVLTELGLSALTYDVYAAALSSGVDTNLSAGLVDTDIDANGDGNNSDGSEPYDEMQIKFYATNQSRDVGDGAANYDIIIEAGASPNGSHVEVWDFIQWALRQTTNQNANSGGVEPAEINDDRIGLKISELLEWRADGKLHTKAGVFIDNLSAASHNSVVFHDVGDATHEYPLSVPIVINFNPLLVSDPNGWFHLYVKTGGTGHSGEDYGTASAITVTDTGASEIKGAITGAQMAFTYDYTSNNEGGYAGQDFDVVLVARGASQNGAGWARSDKTLTSAGVSFDLNPPTDRAFFNPPG